MINHEASASAYKVLTIIGSCFNGIGSVWLARNCVSGKLVALKKYDLDKCSDEIFNLLHHETCTMRSLSHANMMPCMSTFVRSSELWLIEPLCGYGSTKDLLAAHFNEGLPERAIALILRDVLSALEYLHRQGIVHRGVRASHVLVCEDGHTYLSGVRSAVSLYVHGRKLSVAHSYPLCATSSLNWLSPELLAQDLRGYGVSSDVYSVGVMACELANGMEPFAQMPATAMLYEKLRGSGEPVLLDSVNIDPQLAASELRTAGDTMEGDTTPSSITPEDDTDDVEVRLSRTFRRLMRVAPCRRFSDAFHAFVRVCVQREPQLRPSVEQLLTHPFIGRVSRRAGPSLPQLLRPGAPVNQCNLLEGEQIKSDSLHTEVAPFLTITSAQNQWDF